MINIISSYIALIASLLALSINCNAQTTQQFSVSFQSNSSELSLNQTDKIDAVINQLINTPKAYRVELTGHTDSTGGASFNKQLSTKRATEVGKYFQSKGFLPRKTKPLGKGQSSPIASNNTEIGKVKNRRVEITISIDIPNINSIGGLTIKDDKFRISSEKGGIITAPSGTKLRIAPGTFIDSKGKPVKGDIDITYREYRNPTDFIFSNIPMSIIQNEEMYPFNSAGMFKIEASKNGKPLTISTGKKINIDFAVTEELANMNFYRFDAENNQWGEMAQLTDQHGSQLGQDYWMRTVCQHIDGEKVCSMEDCDAMYFIVQKGTLFSGSKLSISQQLQTGNSFKSENITNSNKLLKELLSKISMETINQIGYSRVYSIKKHRYQITTEEAKRGKSRLMIECAAVSNNEFETYENLKWEYDSKYIGAPKSISNKTWTKCTLTPHKNYYKLELDSDTESFSMDYLTLIPAEKIKKRNRKEYNKTFYDQYDKNRMDHMDAMDKLLSAKDSMTNLVDSLQTKRDSVQKIIAINDSLIMELHEDSLFCFWDNSKPYMTSDEKSLEMTDWLSYFDNNKSLMKKRYDSLKNDKVKYEYCARMARLKIEMEKELERNRERLAALNTNKNYEEANENANIVVQSLSIAKLGIYNCDQVGNLKNPVTVIADYVDEKGKTIEPLLAFLIDDTFNGMLRYDGNYGLSPYVFAFSPTSGNTLIIFDENANAYICYPDQFKQIENVEDRFKHTFKVKKIKSLKTKEDLLKQ